MRRADRGDLLLVAAVAMIVGSAAVYGSLLWTWLSGPAAPRAPAAPGAQETRTKPQDPELAYARQAFRDRLLEPRAWLVLSEALARSGRPVDAFYVSREARDFFGATEFRKAHAAVVLRAEPERKPETAASIDAALAARPHNASLLLEKAGLTEASDALGAIPYYARSVHAAPKSHEGRLALARLRQLAFAGELGPRGEVSRLAREGLEELRKAHPREPSILAALGLALLERGDLSTLRALLLEAGRAEADNPGLAAVEGALALREHDPERAVARLTAAWERDPDDMFSAEKLAAIYAQQRGDEESALPYWIALFRREPSRSWGGEPLELVIRRALDFRRKARLKNSDAVGLGRYFASEDASLRAEACERAASFKDPRWIEALPDLLDDDTEIVRRNADYALYQLGHAHPEAVRARRDAWLASGRPLLRARALNLSADLWPEETLPLALAALSDPNAGLRYLVKTLVVDRYYRDAPAARKAAADYLARERDSLVLARYEADKLRAQDRR